jgi:hypothetical protein
VFKESFHSVLCDLQSNEKTDRRGRSVTSELRTDVARPRSVQ